MMHRRQATMAMLCSAIAGTAWRGPAVAANWLPSPAVPDVPLLDQDNRSVRLASLLQGRAVVVSFFYAGCVSVCPPQTALLREASRQWQSRPALRDVSMFAISVDPLGDGPQQLREYARRFDLPTGSSDGWVLLTGAPGPVRQALAAFDVPLGRPDQHPALIWLGDAARNRWTRSSALNPPAVTTRLFEELRR